MKPLATWRAVVIGAGSAGLASAAELKRSGLAVTVLEAGDRAGASWARRYRSLRLNTVRALSGLPGMPIDRRNGSWVPGPAFADYLRDYAQHHGLDVRTGVRALGLSRSAGGGWRVQTSKTFVEAEVVVVATGNAGAPKRPAWSEAFSGPKLHACDYGAPADVSSESVLVVGSGNSATEIATELSTHVKSVWLSVRTPPLMVKSSQMGVATHRISVLGANLPDRLWDLSSLASHRSLYRDLVKHGLGLPEVGSHTKFRASGQAPVAERGFAAAVRSGRISVVPEIVRTRGREIELSNGVRLTPDTLILATGYRPSYPDLLSGHAVLSEQGQPLAWGAPLLGQPGLFVVGSPSLQGDIREHGREGLRVGQAVRAMSSAAVEAGALSVAA